MFHSPLGSSSSHSTSASSKCKSLVEVATEIMTGTSGGKFVFGSDIISASGATPSLALSKSDAEFSDSRFIDADKFVTFGSEASDDGTSGGYPLNDATSGESCDPDCIAPLFTLEVLLISDSLHPSAVLRPLNKINAVLCSSRTVFLASYSSLLC